MGNGSTRLNKTCTVATMLVALSLPGTVLAQAWPSKPVHIVVPFPPGGSTDLTGRVLGANDRIGVGLIGFGLIGRFHLTLDKGAPDKERPAREQIPATGTGT